MEPEAMPPLWALDMATNASGNYLSWAEADEWAFPAVRRSIIAHARTLAAHPEIYKPVDEAELKRRQDAREAAAYCAAIVGLLSTVDTMRGGALDENASIQSAYIALCHRDGVTPTPLSDWSDK